MPRTSQIVTGILLIPYVVCGIVLCFLVMDRQHCDSTYFFSGAPDATDGGDGGGGGEVAEEGERRSADGGSPGGGPADAGSPDGGGASDDVGTRLVDENNAVVPAPQKSLDNRYCAGGYHGLLCLIGTLLIGFSIIIYRLLIGTRTRTVKYVHLILHVITLILFSLGLWSIFSHEYSNTYDHINYHGLTSWVVFVVFCIQFIVAAIIFTYLYPNTKLRLYTAPFHDIVGIWLFICCVACCISGKRRAQLDYLPSNQVLFYGISYVGFTCILVVILSPFFEWDMVGPL